MPLAPEIEGLVQAMAQNPDAKPTHELEPAEAREAYRALAALFGPGEDVGKIHDRTVPGPAGDIPVRVYAPQGAGPHPVLAFYHGGGWTIGDLDTHDRECRALCNRAGCLVVSIGYRLGPEHPYPAAVEDSYAALRWLGEHAGELGGDPTRLAVGGDSAGGNLSAVMAQLARERGGPALRFQLLVYPAVDSRPEAHDLYPSRSENAAGPFLLRETMDYFIDHYIPDAARRGEPAASPLLADSLANLPPALVVTAEYDVLRDEGERYAEALQKAGVPVSLHRYDGMPHVFFQLSAVVAAGRELLDEAGRHLAKAFA